MIVPSTSELNRTPSSRALVSESLGLAGTTDEGQIVHAAHPPATGVTDEDGADAADVPTLLVAVTRNVYAVPLLNPVTVADVAGGEPVTDIDVCAVDPAYGVTVYPVIGLPPSEGALQDTTAEASPAVAETPPGAAGAVAGALGVTDADAADAGPVPTAFVAVTVNVYAVPLLRPVTVVAVPGGDPVTVVVACAVAPTYGVTV